MPIVKDRVWESLGYEPHDGQRKVHDDLSRNRVLAAGRRFGKSIVGGRELVPEAALTYSMRNELEERGIQRRFWIGGPDYTDGEKEFRVLYNDMKRLGFPFDHPGTYYVPPGAGSSMHISLWKGLFMVDVKSGKEPLSWDGEGLAGVELVEAAKLKPYLYDQYIRPSLIDQRGWCLMTSTPEGKNWFYKMWKRGIDPSYPNWKSWRMPSWINNHLFPLGADDPEVHELTKDMSPERIKQEIEADFTEFVGRVFKDFDEEVHVGDFEYMDRYPVVAAVDFGWSNPFVWLEIQRDIFDNTYVLGEYRTTHMDPNEITRELLRRPLTQHVRTIFPDPAEPQDAAILGRDLGITVNLDTGGELRHRLEAIRKALKLYPEDHPVSKRKPKLFIDRSCVGEPLGDGGLIREMSEYRYPATKEESSKAAPEEPLDKDNHGPEALGRYYRGYDGPPEGRSENQGRARVRKARVGTR